MKVIQAASQPISHVKTLDISFAEHGHMWRLEWWDAPEIRDAPCLCLKPFSVLFFFFPV